MTRLMEPPYLFGCESFFNEKDKYYENKRIKYEIFSKEKGSYTWNTYIKI